MMVACVRSTMKSNKGIGLPYYSVVNVHEESMLKEIRILLGSYRLHELQVRPIEYKISTN